MDNNEWDDSLKNLLGNHKPEDLQPDWEAFSNYMRQHDFLEELGEEADFDENLRNNLSSYEAPGKPEGWERIESTLNDDQLFDEVVRDRIHQFKPQYDPRTWPLLLSRLSGTGYLRAKLIAFKVVEVAAVFLLLFTVFKMGQMGKLPFDTPLYERSNNQPDSETNIHEDRADNSAPAEKDLASASNATDPVIISAQNTDADISGKNERSFPNSNLLSSVSSGRKSKTHLQNNPPAGSDTFFAINDGTNAPDGNTTGNSDHAATRAIALAAVPAIINPANTVDPGTNPDGLVNALKDGNVSTNENATTKEWESLAANDLKVDLSSHDVAISDFINTEISPVDWNDHLYLPKPKYAKKRIGTYTEFGIISQVDYNRMEMPEDKLYTAGKVIVFPEKGLRNTSVGSGFTIAVGHPRWAIETGLIYSSKKFKPGRQLVIGSAFDYSSVEFKAMDLQLISLPMQFRYRIDHKGPFRFYSLAGFGIHVITKSNIDVLLKYEFASAAAGQDPNTDPKLANVIQETRRISEHIRDGAPISTKNFLSLNGGLGCEYSISGQKTLFLQSAIQYQLPNVRFSNNNGKNIRSISLQGGVRMPIGK